MDRIFIRQFEVDTIIGIYDHERTCKQRVVLDLELSADIAKAAQSEDIEHALNYKTLTDELRVFIQNSEFQLIETLAERVVDIIRQNYGVAWVKLTLHKPDALDGATDVGVIIERGSLA